MIEQRPRWKEELWEAVESAVRAGASPQELLSELAECFDEALNDARKDAAQFFANQLRK